MFSDWLATFCDAAGVPVPARSDGVSLLPSMTDTGEQLKSTVYVEYFNNQKTPTFDEFEESRRGRVRNQMQMIRLENFVGVRYNIQSPDDDFEIYNVVDDPKETTNLAGSDEVDRLQNQMKGKVLQLRRPDTSAVRPYDNAWIPPTTMQGTTNGVSWSTYQGAFPWIPKADQMVAAQSGVAESITADLLVEGAELLVCKGYVRVRSPALYTLTVEANGTALLRIHDATVIDADFGYIGGTLRSGDVRLAAGLHPFTFYYKRNTGQPAGFNLTWSAPGIARGPLPEALLFRD
jgi:hypothetical protein